MRSPVCFAAFLCRVASFANLACVVLLAGSCSGAEHTMDHVEAVADAPRKCRETILESVAATRHSQSHYRRLIDLYCNAVQIVPGPQPSERRRRGRGIAKREIIPPDERRAVGDSFVRRHPFSTVVKISTGCTGGLISPHHVLTAAHCIHTDGEYVPAVTIGQTELMSETLKRIGTSLRPFAASLRSYHWHSTTRYQTASAWAKDTSLKTSSDFALVTMNPDECILKSYMKMQPLTVKKLRTLVGLGDSVIHFTSFADDKPRGSLWYRNCGVIYVDRRGMIFFDCDATFGSSGAVVYVYVVEGTDPNTGRQILRRRVVGVNSGSRFVTIAGRRRRLNVATGITPRKYREICRWAPGMCDLPEYLDRETKPSDSWMMTCGGPPTTPPPPTTPTPSTPPVITTQLPTEEPTQEAAVTPEERNTEEGSATASATADNRGRTGAGGEGQQTAAPGTERANDGSTREQELPPTPVPTTIAATTIGGLSRFERFCIGLGQSLREECLRHAAGLGG
eukprot:scpid36638/ scgid20210/ Serine protease 23; Putative secreted protein Zsig13